MKREEVWIQTDVIRLGQLLKMSGAAENGGLAKAMIQDGIVMLNGVAETRRGKQIVPGDVVTIQFADEPLELTVHREQ